jgi:uncharacterized protein
MNDQKTIPPETESKYRNLLNTLKGYPSLAVAFSGGVDSTFLLQCAHDVLGDRVTAFTAKSCSFPERELNEAREFCASKGIRHIILESEELDIPGFRDNPKNRCYLCKHELFEKIIAACRPEGIAHVAEGSNSDDDGDYRPGLTAVAELGVLSPLRQAGLCKEEIRLLSRRLGLSTWDKQSFACLSSRFVYGEKITPERLGMIDRAEQLLLDLGFHQVRVRIHGQIARIEVLPDEIAKVAAPEMRGTISDAFRKLGFSFVTLDLNGYQTGSMNRTLPHKPFTEKNT